MGRVLVEYTYIALNPWISRTNCREPWPRFCDVEDERRRSITCNEIRITGIRGVRRFNTILLSLSLVLSLPHRAAFHRIGKAASASARSRFSLTIRTLHATGAVWIKDKGITYVETAHVRGRTYCKHVPTRTIDLV